MNDGRLDMPVLFLHARIRLHLRDGRRPVSPIRCARVARDLTEVVVATGHWMAQENPVAVNAALARWIATKLPSVWPG